MTITLLGIDVGSVAAGAVVVNGNREILASGYRFHKGDIATTLGELLTEFRLHGIDGIVATESTPQSVLSDTRYNNQLAATAAAKRDYPDLGALLQVGGEKFYLATFDNKGQYLGTSLNTSCAAGTGSFLDQQAGRLHLTSITELAKTAAASKGEFPQIASRCAVFAKTDLIHAQQEGYQLEEISNGLCHGLAKNLVDTLFAGAIDSSRPTVFCGGVSKNFAVVNHLEQMTGLPITVPPNGYLYGALGACFTALDSDLDKLKRREINNDTQSFSDLILSTRRVTEKSYSYQPLELQYSEYPSFDSLAQYICRKPESEIDVEVDIYQDLETTNLSSITLGLDIGSTSTKAVLIDDDLRVICGLYARTAGRPLIAAQNIFYAIREIEKKQNLHFTVTQAGTTGSGRKFIGKIIGADHIIDEITGHARAAYHLNPQVDTIIEIGGQDAKFTTLRDGRVTFSTMNNVCAAGTGSFIEEQAAKLGCPVEEYSSKTEGVRAPMTSDRCTVFMERDINHFLAEGYRVEEVLASALHSVRENYLQKVATEKNIGSTIFFQGATAKNKALVAAFEQRLGRPILVSKFCHLTGALGTALLAREERIAKTAFKGFGLHKQAIPITSEVCELCNNKCKISKAHVKGTPVAYGLLCGRDYESKKYKRTDSKAFDLLGERRQAARFNPRTVVNSSTIIGIPSAVHLVDEMVLWTRFFDFLGISTVTSEKYSDGLIMGKNLSQAEFCAPINSMHGHTEWLLKRADYVFLPTYLENKAKDGRRHFCYYTQFLPSLISTAPGCDSTKILRPVIKYLYTPFHTKMQLFRMLQGVRGGSWNFLEVSSAYDRAVDAQKAYEQRLKSLFTENSGESEDNINVVFLGRPYTLFSSSMNGNIPDIFKQQGISCYYQDMIGYQHDEVASIQPLLKEIHWQYGAKILETAAVTATRNNLYPVMVTSFKCSPDSFTVDYFKSIMDNVAKPYLILELDGYDSSVGYETRIEAAIRAFKNHKQSKSLVRNPSVSLSPPSNLTPETATNLKGKHILFPNWDPITCSFLTATLVREGYDAHLLQETDETIRKSLRHNSGQCIPLNAVAESAITYIHNRQLDPANCVLWLNDSSLACNIRLYPFHIQRIFNTTGGGIEKTTIYKGDLSFGDISLIASKNCYFSYMVGGMLRKIACRIRPYEVFPGETDRVLKKSIQVLTDAFAGKRTLEKSIEEVVSKFEWIETEPQEKPKIAVFGDLYSRDNRVMNQDLIRFIETHGGEVITTPYNEYAKMVAPSYFRKWFNEGKYLNVITSKAMLTAMQTLEKKYSAIFNRILREPDYLFDDHPSAILAKYNMSIENSGESMDNILKIHYIHKYHPDVSLLVQASPALCCASLITEAMKKRIETLTGIPVVSITYDGTGGGKNDVIVPYLKYPRKPIRENENSSVLLAS